MELLSAERGSLFADALPFFTGASFFSTEASVLTEGKPPVYFPEGFLFRDLGVPRV